MTTSKFVMLLSWGSIFTILWLMIFRLIPRNDLFSWGLCLLFLIVAGLVGASMERKR